MAAISAHANISLHSAVYILSPAPGGLFPQSDVICTEAGNGKACTKWADLIPVVLLLSPKKRKWLCMWKCHKCYYALLCLFTDVSDVVIEAASSASCSAKGDVGPVILRTRARRQKIETELPSPSTVNRGYTSHQHRGSKSPFRSLPQGSQQFSVYRTTIWLLKGCPRL